MAAHMSGLAGICSFIGWQGVFHEWKYGAFMIFGWWVGTFIGVKLNIK